eukprot:CAMPEP_0174728160 /NCGR_PEP_ID=MMETSP1094-20130205/51217_1 /TAXON_ID=156173 /ORGANISM="Chrysochromulina brevifilum, Strain UTEX LB 985" /LENGTH=78 /DNA_ID=CAMNT_0015930027 /DNA_START=39 /DNA_END=275 /DNA_ORIENTATION=+
MAPISKSLVLTAAAPAVVFGTSVSGRRWPDTPFQSSLFFRGARSMMISDARTAAVGAGRDRRTVLATTFQPQYDLERC